MKISVRQIEILTLIGMCVLVSSIVYGFVGYMTVTYSYRQEIESNLDIVKITSCPSIAVTHIDIILSHPMWEKLNTPTGYLGYFRPTHANTLYKEYTLLLGLRDRYEKLTKAYESITKTTDNEFIALELNRATIPDSEMERLAEFWNSNKDIPTSNSKSLYRNISDAWVYQNANWYFWIGPGLIVILDLFWLIFLFIIAIIKGEKN